VSGRSYGFGACGFRRRCRPGPRSPLTGRYLLIEDERWEPRSVHSLKTGKPADLFDLVRRYSLLAFLVDTEYGSATCIAVERPARFEARGSTTGLRRWPGRVGEWFLLSREPSWMG
jgi:hypothetical protein